MEKADVDGALAAVEIVRDRLLPRRLPVELRGHLGPEGLRGWVVVGVGVGREGESVCVCV